MLDLVLCDLGSECVEMRDDTVPLVPPDAHHPPLGIVLSVPRPARPLPPVLPSSVAAASRQDFSQRWQFRKADLCQLYKNLAALTWDEILGINDVNKALSILYNKINDCLQRYVPVKQQRTVSSKYQYPTWYTPEIISCIRDKHYFHLKYKQLQNMWCFDQFKHYRKHAKQLIRVAYKDYILRIEADIKSEPKLFWKFVREQRSSRNTYEGYEYDGRVVTGVDAANAFATYFKSVFHTDAAGLSRDRTEHSSSAFPSITLDYINSADVAYAVKRLKAFASVGPDGIPSFLVKYCISVFMKPLLHIYNLSLRTATYPSLWKVSRVTPIPKAGSSSDVTGYRPIAVLSAIGKLFDSIINRHISRQVRAQISECQHGFRAGRSTTTNLINLVDYCVTELDQNRQVDAAYFDLRKAFDRVQTHMLLEKFQSIGFSPNLVDFSVTIFITEVKTYRSQAVNRSHTRPALE